MTLLYWAMSFARWRCANPGCRQIVEWEDAAYLVDESGKFCGVECRGCHEVEPAMSGEHQ